MKKIFFSTLIAFTLLTAESFASDNNLGGGISSNALSRSMLIFVN